MAVLNISVVAGPDDGQVVPAITSLDNTVWYSAVGHLSPFGGYATHSYYRFVLGTTIPILSTINTCYISLYSDASSPSVGSPLTKVYMEKAAAPTQIADYADWLTRVRTTAGVDWDALLTLGAYTNSPSLVAVLQEVVNAHAVSVIQILHDDDGSGAGDNNQGLWEYDKGPGDNPPKIYIDYTPAAGGGGSGGGVVVANMAAKMLGL